MAVPKWIRPLVELAQEAGWTYETTGRGHPRLRPPSGLMDPRTGRQAAPITMAATPSDKRAMLNAAADLRRLGVPVPHKGHTAPKSKR